MAENWLQYKRQKLDKKFVNIEKNKLNLKFFLIVGHDLAQFV